MAASKGAEKKALTAGLIFWEISVLYILVSIDFVQGRVFPPSRKTPNPVESYWNDWNSYAKWSQSNVNVTTPFRSIDLIVLFCYDLTCLNHLRTLSLNQCFYSVWSGPRRQDTVAHLPVSLLLSHEKGAPQPPPISSLIQRDILSSQGVPFAYLFKGHQYLICKRVAEDHKSTHKGPQAE